MFPNLNAEMARAGLNIKSLSAETGITYESMKNKLSGTTEFKRIEMQKIRNVFPNCSIDYLFATDEETAAAG